MKKDHASPSVAERHSEKERPQKLRSRIITRKTKRTAMETAIFVIGVVATVAGILAGVLFSTNHRDAGIWFSCASVVLVIGGGFCWLQDHVWKFDAELQNPSDLLTRGTEVTPEVKRPPDRPPLPESVTYLFLGKTVAWTDSFPRTIVKQAGEDMLVMGKEADGIWISGKFFNKQGKVLAELEKNRFIINNNQVFRIKRTNNRLTVFDDEARMALDITYLNGRAIRVLGDYYLRGGLRFRVHEEDLQAGVMQMRGGVLGGGAAPIFVF